MARSAGTQSNEAKVTGSSACTSEPTSLQRVVGNDESLAAGPPPAPLALCAYSIACQGEKWEKGWELAPSIQNALIRHPPERDDALPTKRGEQGQRGPVPAPEKLTAWWLMRRGRLAMPTEAGRKEERAVTDRDYVRGGLPGPGSILQGPLRIIVISLLGNGK